MDEVAFVDSLLAPEMRAAAAVASAPGPFAPPSYLLPSARLAKPTASGHLFANRAAMAMAPTTDLAPPVEDDDLMLRHLLGSSLSTLPDSADLDETGSLPPLSARSLQITLAALASPPTSNSRTDTFKAEVENPPVSTNSLLFEPLELPRTGIAAPVDQSIKDAFGAPTSGNGGTDSPVVSPPNSTCSLRSLVAGFQDPCATPRSPVYSDPSAMMPVQPLGQHNAPFGSFGGGAMPFWMTAGSSSGLDGFDTTSTASSPPVSMKQLLFMANMGSNGFTSPPNSNGSTSSMAIGPFTAATLSASFSMQPDMQQNQWFHSRMPTVEHKPSTGRKRARSRQSGSSTRASAAALALSLSMGPLMSKELVVSTDYSDYQSEETQGRAKRACTSRVRSPSTVSPTADGDLSTGRTAPKGKKCVEPGCTRRAQSNSRCKAHGGGARCQFAGPGGCSRSSQGGGFCRAHGGGKRCEFPGCVRGQQRKGRCYVHGGIRKCQWGDCEKKDRGNGFCIAHGGGKRCEHPGCARAVRRGRLCQLHETGGEAEGVGAEGSDAVV